MTGRAPSCLLELAERCEQATGPDREMDVAIVYALYPGIGNYAGQCIGDDPIFWHEPYRKQPCPAFTASLDAAMTLVPEGFRLFSLGEARYMTRSPAFCAQLEIWVSHEGVDRSMNRSIGVAATPALALCAAALRARASNPTPPSDGDEK